MASWREQQRRNGLNHELQTKKNENHRSAETPQQQSPRNRFRFPVGNKNRIFLDSLHLRKGTSLFSAVPVSEAMRQYTASFLLLAFVVPPLFL
jgi:hypothetical protein